VPIVPMHRVRTRNQHDQYHNRGIHRMKSIEIKMKMYVYRYSKFKGNSGVAPKPYLLFTTRKGSRQISPYSAWLRRAH
jgi:hypothetical protein